MHYHCDTCELPFEPTLLQPVTIDRALYFCCSDCVEKISLFDFDHMTFEDLKRVLNL